MASREYTKLSGLSLGSSRSRVVKAGWVVLESDVREALEDVKTFVEEMRAAKECPCGFSKQDVNRVAAFVAKTCLDFHGLWNDRLKQKEELRFEPVVAWRGENKSKVYPGFPVTVQQLENLKYYQIEAIFAFYKIDTSDCNKNYAKMLQKLTRFAQHPYLF
jgi:hypothetical protein